MRKDELYRDAFRNIFAGVAMFVCFTLFPLVCVASGALDKPFDPYEIFLFVGLAAVFLFVFSFSFAKMAVCLGDGADDGRAYRLQRLANAGEKFRMYGNPVGLVAVLVMGTFQFIANLSALCWLISHTQDPPDEKFVE